MERLASTIRENLDTLAEEYDHRLHAISDYAEIPDPVRLESARFDLELIATCLEKGDDAEFVQFIQTRAGERVAQGFTLESLLQALAALEASLLPLITRAGAAKFLWRALSEARNIVAHRTNEMLLESERRYRRFIEEASDVVYIISPQGHFTYASPPAEKLTGYTVEELVGMHFADLIPAEWQERVAAFYVKQFQERARETTLEFPIVTRSGEEKWVEQIVTLLADGDWVIEFQSIVRDVTERKRAEEALRESEARFRDVALSTSDWVWEVDAQGRYTYCSERVVDVLGYTAEEMLGQTPFDLMPPGEAARVGEIFAKIAANHAPIVDLENLNIGKDGHEVYLLTNGVPLLDEAGNLVGYRGVDKDVTEQKQAGEELRRLERAVEQSVDGIAVADMDGNIQFVNPAWAQMHGYSVEELRGRPLGLFHTEEQLREDVIPFNEQVMATGAHQGEVGHVRKDGTTFPTWMTTSLLRDEQGNPVGLVGTARDITERKQLEQQIEESLARRTQEVQLSTEVAQEIAAAPALEELYRRVVTLVKERFGYYHAQIFRRDPELDAMRVVEGYGAVGEKMKAAGHNLPYGRGVVGTAAATGEPVLAPDVSIDPYWVPHPDLPATKGELAVPIRLRDEVLGVLDVQSDVVNALSEEDQIVLLGLAGQIASAIESTQALEQANIFRQFVEASGQAFGMAALDGGIVYANPTLTRILGARSPQALLGQNVASYYPQELVQRVTEEILPTVMRTGEWTGELLLVSPQGQVTPTIQNIFLIRDVKGSPLYLANVIADITERKQAEAEMQETLRELERLTRAMSREGWEAFRRKVGAIGYLFDQVDVIPTADFWVPEIELAMERQALVPPASTSDDQPMAVTPLSVRGGEVIGVLGIQDDPQRPLSEDDLALVEAISEQVALALEGSLLFEQTQEALSETEALYEASRAIITARDQEEIVEALVEHIDRTKLDRVVVLQIIGTVEGQPLIEVQGMWDRAGQEQQFLGQRFSLAWMPLLGEIQPGEVVLVNDIATAPDIDERTRAAFQQVGVQSVAILPIGTGQQPLGWLHLETTTAPREFNTDEVRRYVALAGQAAVALEGQRLLAETERRAHREQLIREITAKIRASTDLDTILNTAVRELNTRLGTSRTFVHLSVEPESEEEG